MVPRGTSGIGNFATNCSSTLNPKPVPCIKMYRLSQNTATESAGAKAQFRSAISFWSRTSPADQSPRIDGITSRLKTARTASRSSSMAPTSSVTRFRRWSM